MSRAKVLTASTLYVTVELLEKANLQPGDTVSIDKAAAAPMPALPALQEPLQASVTTQPK